MFSIVTGFVIGVVGALLGISVARVIILGVVLRIARCPVLGGALSMSRDRQ